MKKYILYIVEDEKSAQFRYRVYNVAKTVRRYTKQKVVWLSKTEIDDVDLGKVDFVVILRQISKDGKIIDFINRSQRRGLKVLFDLDDLVFDWRDLFVLMWSIKSKNIVYWAGYCWGIRRIAKMADGFICTNGFLAKKLRRSFGKPVGIIRNSLNENQIEVSEKYLQKKNHKGFVIGYFSGSPTHAKDFGLVEPELVRFLEKYNDARLRVVGYMKFSSLMKRLIEKGKVEVIAPVGYLKLQKLIAEVDVNIAPLVINDFTNCKSELKFFEAAIVETTTIASPTYTFKKAIKDGENGFLAKPGEWYDKLEYLYKYPEENKKIAKNAKKYALKHYYGKEFLKEVEDAYDYFAK